MVKADAIEGMIDETLRFHYDMFTDVLYLRLLEAEGVPTLGETTDDGDVLHRDEATGRPVGLTVISWWQRFGSGPLPDSITEIVRRLEPWVGKIAA